MRKDSSMFEPFLADGDYSKPMPVQRSSYWEKLWGILLRSSAASRPDLEKNIEHGVCSFSNKSMTEPTEGPVQRRSLILILVYLIPLALLIFVGLALCFLCRIGAEENVTAAILVAPKYLTDATLLEAKMQEPSWGAMSNCLGEAIREFSVEPNMVKKNARMSLQCNGSSQEFLSGKGENSITVLWIDGKVHYKLEEASSEVHIARLGRHTLPLNLDSILRVLYDLASHNGSEELQKCLKFVLEKFPKEPRRVQDSAKLEVSCGGAFLSFISAEGQNKINVYRVDADGKIQFQVKATGRAQVERFFTSLWEKV